MSLNIVYLLPLSSHFISSLSSPSYPSAGRFAHISVIFRGVLVVYEGGGEDDGVTIGYPVDNTSARVRRWLCYCISRISGIT